MDKLDIKLWTLASKGQIVPDRSLLKTPEQIEMIKKSAELNTAVLDHVAAHIHAGMSTAEIDKLVYDFTTEHGGIPAPLNYEGFPKSVCTSINNVKRLFGDSDTWWNDSGNIQTTVQVNESTG